MDFNNIFQATQKLEEVTKDQNVTDQAALANTQGNPEKGNPNGIATPKDTIDLTQNFAAKPSSATANNEGTVAPAQVTPTTETTPVENTTNETAQATDGVSPVETASVEGATDETATPVADGNNTTLTPPTTDTAPVENIDASTDEGDSIDKNTDVELEKLSKEALEKLPPELKAEYEKADAANKKAQKDIEAIISKFKKDLRVKNIRDTQKVAGIKEFEKNYKTFIKSAGGLTLGAKIGIGLLAAGILGGGGLTVLLKCFKNSSKKLDADKGLSMLGGVANNTTTNTTTNATNDPDATPGRPGWMNRIRDAKASDADIEIAYQEFKKGKYQPGPKTLEEFKKAHPEDTTLNSVAPTLPNSATTTPVTATNTNAAEVKAEDPVVDSNEVTSGATDVVAEEKAEDANVVDGTEEVEATNLGGSSNPTDEAPATEPTNTEESELSPEEEQKNEEIVEKVPGLEEQLEKHQALVNQWDTTKAQYDQELKEYKEVDNQLKAFRGSYTIIQNYLKNIGYGTTVVNEDTLEQVNAQMSNSPRALGKAHLESAWTKAKAEYDKLVALKKERNEALQAFNTAKQSLTAIKDSAAALEPTLTKYGLAMSKDLTQEYAAMGIQ